jgi:hypothetical protein
MGGQACILYGAAEFSRDVDVLVLASDRNLRRLETALRQLKAEPVFVPSLGRDVLLRGHACHFRIRAAAAKGLRIDVMAVMHGCGDFEELWARRRRVRLSGTGLVNVLGLADLVRAKKTQRDKDWPMVRRLVEADYQRRPRRPTKQQVRFWLREARSSGLLADLCRLYPKLALELAMEREVIRWALKEDVERLEAALRNEEASARDADRAYWKPLRQELFEWRQERSKKR